MCTSVVAGDYDGLATCSPDVPDLTMRGRLRKAWEKRDEGIFLLKGALREDGVDHVGALLESELCALLFGEGAYQPLSIEERCGKRFSASPLMLSRDEGLVQGARLFALCGMQPHEMEKLSGLASPQDLVGIFARAGVESPSAHAAKITAYNCLALLSDSHTGNYGVICNRNTGERRAAPPFDYDRSFGFSSYSDHMSTRSLQCEIIAPPCAIVRRCS